MRKKGVILKDPKLFILLEAESSENSDDSHLSNAYSYNLWQIGIPRAWRADGHLGIIVESDIDNLTKISSLFLSNPILIDHVFEINRIQSMQHSYIQGLKTILNYYYY